jgi:HAD superfamily hydrolase (TIGR01509 family)
MIKAIFFDCYGVLATGGLAAFRKRYFGHDKALMQWARDLSWQAEEAAMDYNVFVHELALKAGVSDATAHTDIERSHPNEELFTYIRDFLKPRYKVGMLSNAASNRLREIFELWQLELLDITLLSCEIDVAKPEPRAYQIAAERLAVLPAECVLIDDQERHCNGARTAGMQAIYYKSFDTMRAELEVMLTR